MAYSQERDPHPGNRHLFDELSVARQEPIAMRSSTIVLAVGLLASPLALVDNPQSSDMTTGLAQLVQYATGAPEQRVIGGRPLTDAPRAEPLPGVAPVDRVAGPGSRSLNAGPVNALPFSAAPLSNAAAGSPGSPNGTPGDIATPNLGR
jgi:hypothetical protein